jgi:FMN-dependent NADH-azoreductase
MKASYDVVTPLWLLNFPWDTKEYIDGVDKMRLSCSTKAGKTIQVDSLSKNDKTCLVIKQDDAIIYDDRNSYIPTHREYISMLLQTLGVVYPLEA